MELRQLKYFVKSAETLNFTQAAKLCFISQSTLSQQIQQLENQLKVTLFERIGKRIYLTESGKAFLPFALRTLEEAELGVQRLHDLEGLRSGHLRIGATWGLTTVMVDTLSVFCKQYPQITFEIIYRKANELIEMLHNREIDLALSFNLLEVDSQMEETHLFESKLCVVVAEDHNLANRKFIKIDELTSHSIAVPAKGMNARMLFDNYIQDNNLTITPKVEINEIYSMLHLIKSGKWVGILADATIFREQGVVAIPLENGIISMNAVLLQLQTSYQRNAVKFFIDTLRYLGNFSKQ